MLDSRPTAPFPKLVLKSTIFTLEHEGETAGHGQLEGNHQFLFSNEDFFILLLPYSSPRNAYCWRVSDLPNGFF